jgi:hypothetical protein
MCLRHCMVVSIGGVKSEASKANFCWRNRDFGRSPAPLAGRAKQTSVRSGHMGYGSYWRYGYSVKLEVIELAFFADVRHALCVSSVSAAGKHS